MVIRASFLVANVGRLEYRGLHLVTDILDHLAAPGTCVHPLGLQLQVWPTVPEAGPRFCCMQMPAQLASLDFSPSPFHFG